MLFQVSEVTLLARVIDQIKELFLFRIAPNVVNIFPTLADPLSERNQLIMLGMVSYLKIL